MNFVRVGNYDWSDGTVHGGNGGYGYYWSTTAISSTDSHYYGFGSSFFNPQDHSSGSSKGYGFSVRCIAHQWHFREIIKIQELISSTSPSVIVENAPLNFVRSGMYYWSSGTIESNGRGVYWTATISESAYAKNLVFGPSYFNPQNYNGDKGHGFTVR